MPESIDNVARVFRGVHHRSSLVLLAAAIWLTLCLPPLLLNRPDSFQASGSIIVAIAILIYARERARRESEVTQAQRSQIVALLDEHENWGVYHESQVLRSAMENELALLQLRRSIANDGGDNAELNRRIDMLQKELQGSSEHHEQLRQKTLDAHNFRFKVHNDAESVIHLQAPAAKTLERFEIALVVLGTLQWGYGDRLVVLIHSLF